MPYIAVATVKVVRCLIAGGVLAPFLVLPGWASPQQVAGNKMPRSQKSESRHVIDGLEEKWRDAVLKNDVNALDSLMADDYVGIMSNGTLETKAQAIDRYRSGAWHVTTLNTSDRKVRFYGRTAVVTSLVEAAGSGADGPIDGMYRYTRVYARESRGIWKIVNFEANHLDHPHEHDHTPKDHS